MSTEDAREQQRTLYGAPLAEIGATVMSSLHLTQGRLAEVLGLSAPMLSQLLSGQRVKIGNPAVVHRLQLLLDLAGRADGMGDEALATRVAEIRGEQSTLTGSAPDDAGAVRLLAASATSEQLALVAAAADEAGAGPLATLLRRASGAARG